MSRNRSEDSSEGQAPAHPLRDNLGPWSRHPTSRFDISESADSLPEAQDFRTHRVPAAALDWVGAAGRFLLLAFVVVTGCGLHIAFLRAVTAP